MPPSLVIFDMDDVLCRYDLRRRLQVLSEISGKAPKDIHAAIWESGFEDESDAGRYQTAAEYLAQFGARLGYPLTREQWVRARRTAMTPNRDALKLAQDISTRARIALHTNNGPLLKETLAEIFPEAAKVFGNECYFAYEFRAKKPDPLSYTRLLDRLGFTPAEAWFIDDKRENVEGAIAVGLSAHHFTDHQGLAKAAHLLGL
jgi:HAD superfamily hydrolase (TIGR01509 family)